MIEGDKKTFASIMNVLGELYEKEISPSLVELYWRMLKAFPLEKIQKGVYSHINDECYGVFMPKPADIKRYIEMERKEKALDAWSKVESAIRNMGRYSTVAFDDPITDWAISQMGGWGRLCSSNLNEIPMVANRFLAIYLQHADIEGRFNRLSEPGQVE